MASSSVWIPAVTGNVEIVSTDPVYHYNLNQIHDMASPIPPQMQLICDAIKFVVAKSGKTGAYISTSCSGSLSKSASFLDPFGSPGFIQVSAAAGVGLCPPFIALPQTPNCRAEPNRLRASCPDRRRHDRDPPDGRPDQ